MTAVEWLVDQLELDVFASTEEMAYIIMAKEIEKEQIINAVNESIESMSVLENFRKIKKGEQYYNETFKQQEQ